MTTSRIGVVLEERFKRLPDGRIFSPSGFGVEFWNRYRAAFGSVRITARIESSAVAEPSWAPVPAELELGPVFPFLGPAGLVRTLPRVLRSFDAATSSLDGLIVRAPGTLALLAARTLGKHKRPFAVELVGDPVDVFGAGIAGRLGPILQKIFARNTRWLCGHADAVSYVTRDTLQRRYPSAPDALTIACSSVQLSAADFAPGPRTGSASTPADLFCAGSLEVPYKGVDVLIDALGRIDAALRPSLAIAGDGRLRASLEARATGLGLDGSVRFLGRLDKQEVRDRMRQCDLYVQPSLTEGLPRAIIEAMAAAAPVVASDVGGIPELLDPSELVPPGQADALAERIVAVLSDSHRRAVLSQRNLVLAAEFSADILDARRRSFYNAFDAICAKGNTLS